MPKNEAISTPKKGLVLAGGGAKGSYQIGVWQALCELGWKPDIITGTSIGSLNGAMFVLDAADVARDMWLQIERDDVLNLPEDETRSEWRTFLREVVREGGVDISPLEAIVDRVLDEDAVRCAKIRFGLVTVEMIGLRRRQLSIDEIPQGKLKEFLLASAACFPAFAPREIDGTAYVDGGYQDIMPFELAARMGASELICVDIDGMGITRKNHTQLPTITIASHWDLGEMLSFDVERARQNIAVGYFDTLRVFGKIRGTAYAVRLPDSVRDVAQFRVPYHKHLLRAVRANPTLALVELTALRLFKATDKPLAPLEIAAQYAGVSPEELYSVESLCTAFLVAYSPADEEPFGVLCEGLNPKYAAKATLDPDAFLAAIVYTALCAVDDAPLDPPEQDFEVDFEQDSYK